VDEVYTQLDPVSNLIPHSFKWKLEIIKQQVEDSVRRLDERRGIVHIRRHLAATPIFKGIPNFKDTRIAMLRAETVAELFRIIDSVEEFVDNQ
jgi:tRNA-dihydrouridine synthase